MDFSTTSDSESPALIAYERGRGEDELFRLRYSNARATRDSYSAQYVDALQEWLVSLADNRERLGETVELKMALVDLPVMYGYALRDDLVVVVYRPLLDDVDPTKAEADTIVLTVSQDGDVYGVDGDIDRLTGWSPQALLTGAVHIESLVEQRDRPVIARLLRMTGRSIVQLRLTTGGSVAALAISRHDRTITVSFTVMGDEQPGRYTDVFTGFPHLTSSSVEDARLCRVVSVRPVNIDRLTLQYTNDALRASWTSVTTYLETVAGAETFSSKFGEIVVVGLYDDDDLGFRLALPPPLITEPAFRFTVGEATGRWPGVLADARRAVREARTQGVAYRFADRANSVNFRSDDLLARLPAAMANGELTLHYQPMIDSSTDTVASVEGLLRWRNDYLGQVNPVEILHAMSGTTLQADIDRWVLQSACQFVRRVRVQVSDLDDFRVWVNLTSALLDEGRLVNAVKLALGHLPGSVLGLEVTEHDIIEDLSLHARQLEELRNLGVRIALDDFGTGSSSLSYAALLPCDELKIDGSFVRDLLTTPESRAVCQSIAALGQGLGVVVVAEMVETFEQAMTLRLMGVTVLQGWLYSPALPADELIGLLRSGGRISPNR